MQYKIYTLQHQKLYDQIHYVENPERFSKILTKETNSLLNRCKELRRDFSILSKSKTIDSLFSDVLIRHKRKLYSFEHIVVHDNKIYVLERKKIYDNQKQLVKEKANYLKKSLGKNLPVEFYILTDIKTSQSNVITIEKFMEKCSQKGNTDNSSHIVNDFVQRRHISLDIRAYLQKKYNIDITHKEEKRVSKWIEIVSFINPFTSKYKGSLSLLSSCIVFFYLLAVIFSYSIYMKDKQFLLTVVLDSIFLILLVKLLKEIENRLPRLLKYTLLLFTLAAFIVCFGLVIWFI